MNKSKKTWVVVILAALLAITGLVATGCSIGGNNNSVLSPFQGGNNNSVCYYGCPNSKRVRKLNTRKSRR